MGRTDTGSRLIAAPAEALYAAHLDAEAIAAWRPPQGMRAEIHRFDPRVGGGYRMAFVYEDAAIAGKSGDNADVFSAEYLELVPSRRIVERVTFESGDPAFAEPMTVTTTFTPEAGDAGDLHPRKRLSGHWRGRPPGRHRLQPGEPGPVRPQR